jgi:hypothetical protein
LNNFDKLVGLHIIARGMETPNAHGNDVLRQQLGRLGIDLAIIGGNEGAYAEVDQGIILAHPTFGGDRMQLGPKREYQLGVGGIEVERTKILTSSNLEAQIPVLNGPRLWTLDKKWEQYQLTSDFSPKTLMVRADESPSESLFYGLQGDLLVVKADLSKGSRHVKICARGEVISAIAGMRSEFAKEEAENGKPRKSNDIIVQEYISGQSWPELKAVNDMSDRILKNTKNTELRVYCFVDRDKNIPFPDRYYATARVFDEENDDDWASIDQESVPSSAWQAADVISDRLLAKADVPGGFFAIDLIKGDANDGLDERIFVREVNLSNPVMVNEKYNKNDSIIQRKLLANLMMTLAKPKKLVDS